ncbi:MAG: hypothetical protein KBT27_14130 [Prevotellaceae bacterium]|nr:hypothetical protein [Candidatus Faecinaster equi]
MAIYQKKENDKEHAVMVQHLGKYYYCAFDGNRDACIQLIIDDFKNNLIEWED